MKILPDLWIVKAVTESSFGTKMTQKTLVRAWTQAQAERWAVRKLRWLDIAIEVTVLESRRA